MKRLVVATRNADKLKEIASVLAGLSVELVSANDFPDLHDVVEDAPTLRENALKKAREVSLAVNEWALADDTGLVVPALNGAPGVYSARYAGEQASYADNCQKLLQEMRPFTDEEKRTAYFSCWMALIHPDGREVTVEGRVTGQILQELRGSSGFGYDPLFYLVELNRTMAELSLEEKNRISHRGKALRKIKAVIEELIAG